MICCNVVCVSAACGMDQGYARKKWRLVSLKMVSWSKSLQSRAWTVRSFGIRLSWATVDCRPTWFLNRRQWMNPQQLSLRELFLPRRIPPHFPHSSPHRFRPVHRRQHQRASQRRSPHRFLPPTEKHCAVRFQLAASMV